MPSTSSRTIVSHPLSRRRLLAGAARGGAGLVMATAAGRLLTACGAAAGGTAAAGGGNGAGALSPSPFGTGVYRVGSTDRVTLGAADSAQRYFYYAIVSDTHVADELYFEYDGVEGSPADTESMRHTADRFAAARDFLNTLEPRLDFIFMPGDIIHNYPTVEQGFEDPNDFEYYMNNRTRIDIAKEVADGFRMPVFMGYGNHDYDVRNVDRRFTEELFLEKYGMPPYYAVDHRGVKLIHLNNFLGATQDPASELFDPAIGSLGETQLQWLEGQLQEGMPAVLFIHYSPGIGLLQRAEAADLDLYVLMERYADTIMHVISGHTHIWLEFGTELGPRHTVVSATRYNPHCYAIVEVDAQAGTHTLLNEDLWVPATHKAEAYDPAELMARAEAAAAGTG